MPRSCSICSHPDRSEIDRALIAGEPYRGIAKRYEASESAVYRHQQEHLPARLLLAAEAEELTDADRLKGELDGVKGDVERLKAKAEKNGDYKTALLGCDKALKALELQAKLLALINDTPTINLQLSPQWIELRAVIVRALETYPDARGAVLRAIEAAGNGRA